MSALEESIVGDLEDENIDQMHLIFSVQKESYGLQIGYVTEIVGLQKIIPVPDVPDYVKGVINLRGRVIPVMDIRLRFGMDSQEYSDRTVIIVIENNNTKTGFVVDGVDDVLEIDEDQISDPPKNQANQEKPLISGVGQASEKVIFLLDVSNLLYEHKP